MPMISSCFSFLYPRFFLGFPTVFPWFFPCFQHQFMLFLSWFYDKFSLDNPMFFPCSYISKTLHYPLFFLSCITGKTNVGDGSVIINSSNNLLIPSFKQRIQRKKSRVFARRVPMSCYALDVRLQFWRGCHLRKPRYLASERRGVGFSPTPTSCPPNVLCR